MEKKNGFLKGALFGALAMLLIVGCVSCAIGIAKKSGDKQAKTEETSSSDAVVSKGVKVKLDYLKALIDGYYIGDADEDVLEQGIYKGFIDGLGDPYSVYYDEEETKTMNESTSGEYGGIGVVVSQERESGIITAIQVYENSPAKEAGMKDGDILYKVEGKEVTGEDLTEVVSRIKGDEGTTVELTVLRGDSGEEVTFDITRRKIEAQTVTYEMKENKTGYIRVTEFDTVTYEQYQKALSDLDAQGMKGLVVDLRSNPGGNLNTVCEMLDLMLPEGLVVYTEDKSGKKSEFTSDAEHQFTKPLAVLMNGYSASASEIFAGAIQDYGIGKIVGTQSYGKGVVQQVFDLKDDTSVKITIAEYFTPNGRNIDGEGITPDVEIEYEADADHPEADNQLDKALEIVKQ